jgi:hypothetical protein
VDSAAVLARGGRANRLESGGTPSGARGGLRDRRGRIDMTSRGDLSRRGDGRRGAVRWDRGGGVVRPEVDSRSGRVTRRVGVGHRDIVVSRVDIRRLSVLLRRRSSCHPCRTGRSVESGSDRGPTSRAGRGEWLRLDTRAETVLRGSRSTDREPFGHSGGLGFAAGRLGARRRTGERRRTRRVVSPVGEPVFAARADRPLACTAGLVTERTGELDEGLAHGRLVTHPVVDLGGVLAVV